MRNRFRVAKLAAETVRSGWTQGTLARTERGKPTSPNSDDAVCWCILGAIGHVAPKRHMRYIRMLEKNAFDANDYSPVEYNDGVAKSGEDVALYIEKYLR